MGLPSGGNLGAAQGSITINTTQAERAPAVMRGVAQGINSAMAGVNSSTNKVTASLTAFAGALRGLAGAFGVSLGVQGVVQLGKMSLELARASAQAELTEASFARMAAGVGQSSDELLEGMQKASRGVITDANLIIGANRAIGTGVANTSAELNQILEIARATGIAYGKSTTEAYGRIVEAVGKLEPELLDELGITVRLDQVFRSYAATLGVTADQLSDAQRKQAFLNEIIRQSKDEVAAAAGAGDNAADTYARLDVATEKLGKSWGDLLNTAGVPLFIGLVSARIQSEIGLIEGYISLIERAQRAVAGFLGMGGGGGGSGTPAWMTGVSPAASGPLLPDRSAEKNIVKLDWARGVSDVNRQMHDDIISEEQDFGRNRADTVRDYNKGVAREERDFGRARLRQELEMLDSIADVHKDASRREARQIEDLARGIGQSRADSEERIADARKDANERLVELEEDYAKNRQRAAEDHRDKMLSAAGRLDAIALLEERKRWARESSDAKEAHDEQRDDLQKQLAERIDDENKSLEKSIRQAQEAHDRQLADARAADAERIDDMKADFIKRKAEEDADRAIRNQDRAIDHADQLTAMDTQHGLRIDQIKRHAEDERIQLDEQADAALKALGIKNKAYDDMIARREAYWEKMWDKFTGHVETSLGGSLPPGFSMGEDSIIPGFARGGPVARTGLALLHRGEFVMPAPAMAMASGMGGSSRSVTVGDIHVNVGGSNSSAGDIAAAVRDEMTRVLEAV